MVSWCYLVKMQGEKITGMPTHAFFIFFLFPNFLKCQLKLLPLRQPINFVPCGLVILRFQEPSVLTSHHLIGCNSKIGTSQVLSLPNSLITYGFLPIKESSSIPAFRCKRWGFKYNAFPREILGVKLGSKFISDTHFIYCTPIFLLSWSCCWSPEDITLEDGAVTAKK